MGSQIVKVALQADVGSFVSGFSHAEGAAGKLGATLGLLQRTGAAVGGVLQDLVHHAQNFAKGAAAAGASGMLFFGGLGLAAAQLEAPLKNVQTLMGSGFGADDFKKMTADVINMSRRLPQSATDLANGLYNIASSGFAGAEGMKVLDVSATAAVAGLTSTQNASTAVTAALNAYGQNASHAKDVSDILFQTVNLGVVTFEQLTGVIGDAVGTAAAAGVSFDQVGSAIATMTRSGISADEAGTSLNRLLQSMIDPSDALAGALHGLGYENGATALATDGLFKVMMKLMKASQGNIGTLLAWFPEIRAARGALALMAADGQTYAEVAGQIENKNNRAGASQRAFAIQSESAMAQFKLFVNSLKAAGLEIGQYFLPAARQIIHFATMITNAFAEIPAPLKMAIGWLGALGSAVLTLGGVMGAFMLKGVLMKTALSAMGTGIQTMSTHMGAASTRAQSFGTALVTASGRSFSLTRLAFTGIGTAVGALGDRIGMAGLHVEEFGTKMTRGGSLVSGMGNVMSKAGNAGHYLSTGLAKVGGSLTNLIGYIPAVIALGFALYNTFQSASDSAKSFAADLEKGMNPKSPDSLMKHFDKIIKKHEEINSTFRGENHGDVFDQFFGTITQTAKNAADIGSNLVGMDIVKDSSWDQALKSEQLNKSEKKIIRTMHNLQKNATEMYNTLYPSKALGQGEVLGASSDDLRFLARVAEVTGKDLTGAFSKSGPARQAAMDEVRKITGLMQGVGLSANQATPEMIKSFEAMTKAAGKAGKGAAEAFGKSFDLFKSIDPNMTFGKILGTDDETLVPVGQQITKFYTDSLTTATKFYNGIQELQARGANPAVIQKMLQAGPEAAGAVVQAAVEDTTNGVIQVLNMGEGALQNFTQRAAEMARITSLAISAGTDKFTKNLGAALQISNEKMAEGPGATIESVAKAIGLTPENAASIVSDFGIDLQHEFKKTDFVPDLPGIEAPFATPFAHVRDVVNDTAALIKNFSKTSGTTTTSLMKDFAKVLEMPSVKPEDITKKQVALDQLRAAINQIPDTNSKNFVMNLINDTVVKEGLKSVMANLPFVNTAGGIGVSQTNVDFIMSLVGQPEAEKQLQDYMAQIGIIPQDWPTMLRVLGTPEAIHQADLVQAALNLLDARHIPITADNTQAIIASGQAQQYIDDIKQGKPPDIWANPEPAKQGSKDAQTAIDGVLGKSVDIIARTFGLAEVQALDAHIQGLRDKTVTITTVSDQILVGGGNPRAAYEAFGGILKNGVQSFARGGMIGNGQRAILWNEPGTGGESYIPWARDRRGRATDILQRTAQAFGYSLVRAGVTQYASGGMQTSSQSSAAWAPASNNISTTIQFNAPVYGEEGMRAVAHTVIDERDRELSIKLRQNRGGR